MMSFCCRIVYISYFDFLCWFASFILIFHISDHFTLSHSHVLLFFFSSLCVKQFFIFYSVWSFGSVITSAAQLSQYWQIVCICVMCLIWPLKCTCWRRKPQWSIHFGITLPTELMFEYFLFRQCNQFNSIPFYISVFEHWCTCECDMKVIRPQFNSVEWPQMRLCQIAQDHSKLISEKKINLWPKWLIYVVDMAIWATSTFSYR